MTTKQDEPTKPRAKRKAVRPRATHKPTGADRAVTVVGRPPNFQRLEHFFASQTALARALGVHRDTVRAWEHGLPTRLRRSSLARVNAVCATAEQAARYLPSEKLVGEWLLAPQIALGGISAAALIQREPDAYQRVLRLIARDAQPVSVGDISDLSTAGDPGMPLAGLPEPTPDPDADPGFLASLG
jgi:DNA-binding XRE family transcriptional regulator